MKLKLTIFLMIVTSFVFAQDSNNYWTRTTVTEAAKGTTLIARKNPLPGYTIFSLDVNVLKSILAKTNNKSRDSFSNGVLVSFPNGDGSIEQYTIKEDDILSPEVAAQNPDLKFYIGKGITDKSKSVYLSLTQFGLHADFFKNDNPYESIEPKTQDLKTYTIFKVIKKDTDGDFMCGTNNDVLKKNTKKNQSAQRNSSNGKLYSYKIALAATKGFVELMVNFYGNENTIDLITQRKLTFTKMVENIQKVNYIFKRDIGIELIVVTDKLSAAPDGVTYEVSSIGAQILMGSGNNNPWGITSQNYFDSLNIDYNLGFTFATLFGYSNGGLAGGGIGSICVNQEKGKTWAVTEDNNSEYYKTIAHELGHVQGANHTFSYKNEGTGMQVESGVGVSIMSYAGKNESTSNWPAERLNCVNLRSSFFHTVNLNQIQELSESESCKTIVSSNSIAAPLAEINSKGIIDFLGMKFISIPPNTPFKLTGRKSTNPLHTYTWEQMDSRTNIVGQYHDDLANAQVAKSDNYVGNLFRYYEPTTSTDRYFPNYIGAGAYNTTTDNFNVLPTIARYLTFAFTERDNNATEPNLHSNEINVNVVGKKPFSVVNPAVYSYFKNGLGNVITKSVNIPWDDTTAFVENKKISVKWNHANTNRNEVNCKRVNILYTTDGGVNFTPLAEDVLNIGSADVIVPDFVNNSTYYRIKVEANDNIFYNYALDSFEIIKDTEKPLTPKIDYTPYTGSSVNLQFSDLYDLVGVSSVELYQNGSLLKTFPVSDNNGNGTNYHDIHSLERTISNLIINQQYEFYIVAVDKAGNKSSVSNTVFPSKYPKSYSYNSSIYRITNVRMKANNNSDTTSGIDYSPAAIVDATSGYQYQNFINTAGTSTTSLLKSNLNTVTVTVPITQNYKKFAIWIDYNQNGVFTDAGEEIYNSSIADNETTFTKTDFAVPITATTGTTRMRISLKYYATNTVNLLSNEVFTDGIVQDYTITIKADTENPTNTKVSEDTTDGTSIDIKWDASSDNVGVTSYKAKQLNSDGITYSTVKTVDIANGDTASLRKCKAIDLNEYTDYSFKVLAYDATGNVSDDSNILKIKTKDTKAPSEPSIIGEVVKTAYTAFATWSSSDPTPGSGMKDYSVKVYKDNLEEVYSLANNPIPIMSIGGLTPNTQYTLLLKARDNADNESVSSINFKTGDDPDKPNENNNPTTNIGGGGIAVIAPVIPVAVIAAVGATVAVITAIIVVVATLPHNGSTTTSVDSKKPDKPSNLTPFFTVVSGTEIPVKDTEVNLAWSGPADSDLSKFLVFQDNVFIGYTYSRWATISGLKAGTTYRFKIQALDYSGNYSDFSDEKIVTMPDITPPSAPTNLTFLVTDDSNAKLNWMKSDDNVAVAGYNIYRNNILIGSTSASKTTFDSSLLNLTSLANYTYGVKAKDGTNNESDFSNLVIITAPEILPLVIQNFKRGGIVTDRGDLNAFLLGCNYVDPSTPFNGFVVKSYDVYMKKTTDETFKLIETITQPSLYHYFVNGLNPNSKMESNIEYQFYMQARNIEGKLSAKTKIISGVTIKNIYNLKAVSKPDGKMYISWTPSVDFKEGMIHHLQIYSKKILTNGTTIDRKRILSTYIFSANSYEATGIPSNTDIDIVISLNSPNKNYFMRNILYTKTPIDTTPTAKSDVTELLLIKNSEFTSLSTQNENANEQVTNEIINIYPNPVSGNLLNVDGIEDNVSYVIVNKLGQKIMSGKIKEGIITLKDLPTGMYTLIFEKAVGNIIKHFIKQ